MASNFYFFVIFRLNCYEEKNLFPLTSNFVQSTTKSFVRRQNIDRQKRKKLYSFVSNFVREKQRNYASHVVRMPIERCAKQLMFNDDQYHRVGRVTPSFFEWYEIIIPQLIILSITP